MQGRSRARPRRLVVDIGGGSTELIIGRGDKPKLMESVSLGCVVHTQRFFGDGMISAARFRRARLAAGVELEFLKQPYRDAGWDQVIGSSGTIKSEEHTSELQSLMRISYAVFCLKKKTDKSNQP